MTDEETRNVASVSYKATISLHIDSTEIMIEKSDISSFYITNDYDNLNLPMFQLFVALSESDYAKVVADRDKVKLRIKLQKKQGVYGVEQEKVSTVFNRMFKIYITDARPFLEQDRLESIGTMGSSNDNLDDDNDNRNKSENVMELFAFTDDVTNNSYVINEVLSSANMTDAIGVVLGRPSYEEILMEPLDNTKSYSEVLIPPYTTVSNLNYLNEQYGFYKTGYVFFAGLDRTYLISRGKKCKAKEPDEYEKVIIHVAKDDSDDSFIDGSLQDDDKKVYHVRVQPIVVRAEDISITNNAINGNKKVLVYPMNGKLETVESGLNNGAVNREILANKYGNAFMGGSMESKLAENDVMLTIPVTGVDIEAFTPNKEFIVKFDDSKAQKAIGGTYRLTLTSFDFKKETEDNLLVNGTIVLKR